MAGYKVTRSDERKGKTHKVVGPDGTTKYFGDPNLKNKPNNPEAKSAWYARHAKSLAANPHFRAYARETWADGGYVSGPEDDESVNMAQGGRLDPKDDSVYITKDGQRTERGLWSNVYMKKKREGKLADGGEVEEPEEESQPVSVEAEQPMEQPRLEVPEIKVPQADTSIAPMDMSLTKRERTKLAELPEVRSNPIATSKTAQGGGGGGGGGLLGKVLGALFAADGGVVPMHFADGGVSLTPEDMNLMKRKVHTALMSLPEVTSGRLSTSSTKPVTKGGGSKILKALGEANAVGAYATGGDVGSFAALTDAITNKRQFPEVTGGDDETEGQSVPLKKPASMADGGVAGLEAQIAELENAEAGSVYDKSGKIAKLKEALATAKAEEADAAAKEATRAAKTASDANLNALDDADAQGEVYTNMQEAAANKAKAGVSEAVNKFRAAPTDADKAAGMSLVDRGGSIVARLLGTGAITPQTAERMSKDFLAGDKPGLYENVKAGIDKTAADKVVADEKAAADKVVADKKAADDKLAADKKAKDEALARETPYEKLDRLATEARDRLAREAAPSAPVASAGASATGGGSDTAAIPTTDKLMEDSVGALPTISAVGAAGVPAAGQVKVDGAVLTALENPATRYTQDTFNKVNALSSRPGEVYNLALRSGYSKDDALKMAIDQGATELTAPRLPTLPSAEDAMVAARQSPEIASFRQAQARLAAIKLRDTQLQTAEAQATSELRTSQNDLAIKAGQDQEVRMGQLTQQRDALRTSVYNDTINLDKNFTDIKTKNSFGFVKTALAFLGTSMGGSVNPYALAKNKINEEMNTQLQMLDKKQTLLGTLIKEGDSMEDAYAKTQARLKLLFGFQMQKAAQGLRDERARLAGLADANKLIMEGSKEQHDMMIKDVNARYEPYRIKLQGDAGKLRDTFEYLKAGGDMEELRQKMASAAADRSVKRAEVKVQSEETQLKREEVGEQQAGRVLMSKLLAGQPLANSGEYAAAVAYDKDVRKALVKPITLSGNKLVEGQGYLLARNEGSANNLEEFRRDTKKALGHLDTMERILAANRYNYRVMNTKDQGVFNTARDEFISALGSKAARNVGVPSDQEYERLASAVPDPGYFNNEGFAKGKLEEFRRVFTRNLDEAYKAALYTPGATAPVAAGAPLPTALQPVKLRRKSDGTEVFFTPEEARTITAGNPGAYEVVK